MRAAIFISCGLLLAGFVLLSKLKLLQRLFVPAAVIAGGIGFGLVQIALRFDKLKPSTTSLADEYRSWPPFLIAVVFAAMLLERPATSFRESLRRTASEGLIVWIIILGQLAIGLAITWLILGPMFGVPIAFGQLLEVSWAGGFGSAAAWGQLFPKSSGFPAARDLGVFFAAAGLLYGVVSGLALVNIALRRRWTWRGTGGTSGTSGTGVAPVSSSFQSNHEQAAQLADRPHPNPLPEYRERGQDTASLTPMGQARVRREMIDPLAFQSLILAAACVVGIALQWFLSDAAGAITDRLDPIHFKHFRELLLHVDDLPLFLFALIGGWIVREIMRLIDAEHLIDPPSLHRITGVAMEFLIVSAIVSMRMESVTTFWKPAIILMLAGAIWCIFTVIWLSPRLLSGRYWFELGIINYEFATATTAQGLMLLRIIDPELESGAAEDYAMAAPLSAPFIGGGVITLALPLILSEFHVGWIIVVSVVVSAMMYAIGRRL